MTTRNHSNNNKIKSAYNFKTKKNEASEIIYHQKEQQCNNNNIKATTTWNKQQQQQKKQQGEGKNNTNRHKIEIRSKDIHDSNNNKSTINRKELTRKNRCDKIAT